MVRCYITDRRQLGGLGPLLDCIRRNLERGLDIIQIREKDLSACELLQFVTQVCRLPNPANTRILVNDRLDIAMAAGAHGVHLPAEAVAPSRLRSIAPPGVVIGVSCHNVADLALAAREGADFAVFGPVFAPLSKASSLPPVGLAALKAAASQVAIPVLALGGITSENAAFCEQAGASGVAGITIFQK